MRPLRPRQASETEAILLGKGQPLKPSQSSEAKAGLWGKASVWGRSQPLRQKPAIEEKASLWGKGHPLRQRPAFEAKAGLWGKSWHLRQKAGFWGRDSFPRLKVDRWKISQSFSFIQVSLNNGCGSASQILEEVDLPKPLSAEQPKLKRDSKKIFI